MVVAYSVRWPVNEVSLGCVQRCVVLVARLCLQVTGLVFCRCGCTRLQVRLQAHIIFDSSVPDSGVVLPQVCKLAAMLLGGCPAPFVSRLPLTRFSAQAQRCCAGIAQWAFCCFAELS